MSEDPAACDKLPTRLPQLGAYLDTQLAFAHDDPMRNAENWQSALDQTLQEQGIGIESTVKEMGQTLILNGSPRRLSSYKTTVAFRTIKGMQYEPALSC